MAKIFYSDLYGKREKKYDFLSTHDLNEVKFSEILPRAPYYDFIPYIQEPEPQGFSISDLFPKHDSSIVTAADSFAIAYSKKEMSNRVKDFIHNDYSVAEFKEKYSLKNNKNYPEFAVNNRKKVRFDEQKIVAIQYRPFDYRWTVFEDKLLWRARQKIMKNFLLGPNVGLIYKRGWAEANSSPVFITKHMAESRTWSRSGMQGQDRTAPLYIYSDDAQKSFLKKKARIPNIGLNIVASFTSILNLKFIEEKTDNPNCFARFAGL